MAGILFIISAPSGSGKSTLVSEVRKQLTGIEFSVSWTTRLPRGSEQDGREYHFTSREKFERMVAAGEFLEHAEVFGKDLYGTPRASLEVARREGHDLVLDIDVQGAAQVRAAMPEAVSIFVLPPNPKVLRTRLRNRSRAEGVVDEAEVFRRLDAARRRLRIIANTAIFWSTTFSTGRWRNWKPLFRPNASIATPSRLPYRSRRVLEVAAGCLQVNSQERLKPVIEAFGIG